MQLNKQTGAAITKTKWRTSGRRWITNWNNDTPQWTCKKRDQNCT